MSTPRYTFDRVVRLLISALVIVALLAVVAYLSEVLLPFVVAFLLAYLLNPFVDFFQRKIFKYRFPAIMFTLLAVVVVFSALLVLLIPMMIEQSQHLLRLLRQLASDQAIAERARLILPESLWQSFSDFLQRSEIAALFDKSVTPMTEMTEPVMINENWWDRLVNFFSNPEISSYLADEKFLTHGRDALNKILPFTATLFAGVFTGMISVALSMTFFLMIFMYLFFILRDFQRVSNGWQKLLPPEHRASIIEFIHDFNGYLHRYFRAQTMIAGFSAIIMAVGFQLIGLPMGIMLGLFCGLLSIIPYLQIVGCLPAALLALIYSLDSGMSFWWIGAQIAVVFIVAQLLYDIILVPRIMGGATGLSPAVILLSLSIWWKFLGVLGFLIALPMTCLLLAYYKRMLEKQQIVSDEKSGTKEIYSK